MEAVDMGSKNTHTGSIFFNHVSPVKFGLKFVVYEVCSFWYILCI